MLNNQKLNFLFDMKKLGGEGGGWQETINFIKGVSRGGGGCLFRNIAKFSVN